MIETLAVVLGALGLWYFARLICRAAKWLLCMLYFSLSLLVYLLIWLFAPKLWDDMHDRR